MNKAPIVDAKYNAIMDAYVVQLHFMMRYVDLDKAPENWMQDVMDILMAHAARTKFLSEEEVPNMKEAVDVAVSIMSANLRVHKAEAEMEARHSTKH